MSTTSSSRASAFATLLALAACVTPPAPDSPGDTAAVAAEPSPAYGRGGHTPVELRAVRVTPLDRTVEPWSREPLLAGAREPLLIDVQVVEPLDATPMDSAPLIVWNDVKLPRTRRVEGSNDRLQAYLVDRRDVRAENSVHVQWEGREPTTKSRRPWVVRPADIGR